MCYSLWCNAPSTMLPVSTKKLLVKCVDGELRLHRLQRWVKTCSLSFEIEYNMASYRVGACMLTANMVNREILPLLEQGLNGHLHNEPGCSVLLLQYWNPTCFTCINL